MPLLTLKIAWSVRRWRSVKTKRGFLGAACCGSGGESSFLLQAKQDQYTEIRINFSTVSNPVFVIRAASDVYGSHISTANANLFPWSRHSKWFL